MEKFIKRKVIIKDMTNDKIIDLDNLEARVAEAARIIDRPFDEMVSSMANYYSLKQADPILAAELFPPGLDLQTKLPQKLELEEKFLPKAIRWASGKNLPLCYGVLDIDGFKKFNDTFGHDEGDNIMKMISLYLTEVVRSGKEKREEERTKSNDRRKIYEQGKEPYIEIGRIGGGEEFGVIFYNMNLETATGIMDRIRVDIENSKIKSKKGQPLNVTISGGVTQYNPHETIVELQKRADVYLGYAKVRGKNIVVNDSNYDGSVKYN